MVPEWQVTGSEMRERHICLPVREEAASKREWHPAYGEKERTGNAGPRETEERMKWYGEVVFSCIPHGRESGRQKHLPFVA